MQTKVWLIGGTKDSITISKILETNNIPFVVSVATATAQSLYNNRIKVFVGCMNCQKMQFFCQQENIKAIVDASHPYAIEVSQNAISARNNLNIPYLRYERSQYRSARTEATLITKVDNFDALLKGNYLETERVLLTTGCKTLSLFKSWQSQSVLYARILPKIESLQTALSAGFTCDRLIAMRPPFNLALERALWQHWNISMVVTKASGKAGGEDIKCQVAADLNIPLIIITRPKITYPQKTTDLGTILAFCQRSLMGN